MWRERFKRGPHEPVFLLKGGGLDLGTSSTALSLFPEITEARHSSLFAQSGLELHLKRVVLA